MTMSLVSTITVGAGGAASISFTGIPATGTDLLVVLSGRGASDDIAQVFMTLNGDVYGSAIWLTGSGSSASSSSGSTFRVGFTNPAPSSTANTFSNLSVYLPNYAGSSNKAYSYEHVSENNATAVTTEMGAGLWPNTAAITSLSLYIQAGVKLAQYSTASLYTITKGSGGATVA